ncbi:unnamed protein product [Rotaria socialis]|uniref:Uncharacterized protein n=1 Tax=Rotaria socialis TaxID=392032 RepID=A0A817LV57_9BILA|nr:unnamed protein product [Rotaria socialis]CAF3317629.1 unnamed protein product [Rotaria socialis]CAF3455499.1 unnamed protein product [Rotaria socialis]CAF3623667.1 unnamed protein product [Rotaria socialis]CAF3685861.1 unnamed protein product [Rotaria socialis]
MKRQSNDGPCAYFGGTITICKNNTHGDIRICNNHANDCENATINISKTNNNDNAVCHNDQMNGTISIYDSHIDNYAMNGSITICILEFNGTITMCNNQCDDATIEGILLPANDNIDCYPVTIEGAICTPSIVARIVK